jgi:SH3-like domain-containing protein
MSKKNLSVRNVKYSEVEKMKHSRLIRLFATVCAWALLSGLFMLPAVPAFAGYNEVIVATDGNGVTVYTGSSGSKKAGILYNGFKSEISLEPTNGRYDCFLSTDCTVWLNLEKATNRDPSARHGSDDWEAKMPCNIFMAEIVNDNTPVYTSPANRKITMRHAAGTLCVVCGEFGKDYYLHGLVYGFVQKENVRKISDMTYTQAHSETYIWDNPETCTICASVANPVYTATSATGYSEDFHFGGYTKNVQAVVLKDLGDWVQLTQGNFVEKRFLDPDGDHSYPVAYVKPDGMLGRLNVRSSASTDSMSEVKLCAGVPVHIISRTEKWAAVFIAAPNGGISHTGCVMTEYLDFTGGDSVRDGCTPVRLTKDLPGTREMTRFYENAKGNVLPEGTLLKVIGVYDHQGNSRSDQEDRFLCETEDGKYIQIENSGVLEPIQDSGVQATVRSAVRMRKAPDPNADVLHQVKAKSKVEVLLRGEIWTLVKYKGETGYMMSRYLSFP